MNWEKAFQALAVLLAAAAIYFFWAGNSDWMFASGVLGSVAFFLSVRFQVKERNKMREAEREAAATQETNDGSEGE
ncbi:MAG: hypothetical protein IPM21_03940 [Acidobacteria bacterium]|nr:hypothetical protein [Acidobacteriota bacterium]